MRFTLHDNIHGSGGTPHPESRAPITDAARAPWVRALHEWLARKRPDDRPREGELDVGIAKLRMRVTRHGNALSATWSVGPEWRVVAASVLLAGDVPADDATALRALRAQVPGLPFADADYAGVAAESRPCLGTLYLDARWFDNGRVELAATALALAALHGEGGRLTVLDEQEKSARPLQFDFTRERFELVMEMVKKKALAARQQLPGVHFRADPPREFLDNPGVLRGRDVFDRLKDTAWLVRWHDGRRDRLSFGEFLGFIDQVIAVEDAFHAATGRAPPRVPLPVNESTWAADPPDRLASSRPVRVLRALDMRQLVDDTRIRRLLGAVTFEPCRLVEQPAMAR